MSKANFKVLFLVFIFLIALVFIPNVPAYAAGGMFIKTAAASSVDLYDVRNDSEDAKVSAYALQGLVNQTSAKVFVWTRDLDSEQLDYSGKIHTHVTLLGGSDAGFRTMFKNNMNVVSKLIIYDPSKDYTYNLACMIGAQQGGIPVTDAQRNSLKSEFGWNGTELDIRNSWSDKIAAYDYALTNLMPNCSRKFVASLTRSDGNALYDYIVATKAFVFWLDPGNSNENAEITKITSTPGFQTNAFCMGYAVNGDGLLNTIEPNGFGYVVSDLFSNGSVWSSFPNKTYTQRKGNAVNAEKGKIYVSIYWSDGDNIQFDQGMTALLWHENSRGYVPVGTTFAAGMQEIASPIMDWFYANKTSNDELIAGPSGYQFIYTHNYKSSDVSSWLSNNNTWVKDAGLNITCPWHNTTASI